MGNTNVDVCRCSVGPSPLDKFDNRGCDRGKSWGVKGVHEEIDKYCFQHICRCVKVLVSLFDYSSHLFDGMLYRSNLSYPQIVSKGKTACCGKKKAEEMQRPLHLTSRTCATRFSTSQVHEFQKLLSSIHIYMATYTEQYLKDEDFEVKKFEVKKFEICGQDFVADLCQTGKFANCTTYIIFSRNFAQRIFVSARRRDILCV